MHLCAELAAAFWSLEPFGEIGANFSLQISSRTRLIKLIRKKLSPKINVKNIQKSSLGMALSLHSSPFYFLRAEHQPQLSIAPGGGGGGVL